MSVCLGLSQPGSAQAGQEDFPRKKSIITVSACTTEYVIMESSYNFNTARH